MKHVRKTIVSKYNTDKTIRIRIKNYVYAIRPIGMAIIQIPDPPRPPADPAQPAPPPEPVWGVALA